MALFDAFSLVRGTARELRRLVRLPPATSRKQMIKDLFKSAVRLARPLHRGTAACPFGQCEIVAHPQLVAVPEYRRSRQCKHQAVGEFDATPVAAQHRRQPPSDAAVVELILRIRPERREHRHLLPIGRHLHGR
jgi:hypothetical protein